MKRIGPMVLKRPEVVIGMDSPDDCAVVAFPNEQEHFFPLSSAPSSPSPAASPTHLNVHTVDFFRSFYEDPFIFGKVAACHALSDCHAMGVPAVSALAVVVLPFGLESKVEDNLVQVSIAALVGPLGPIPRNPCLTSSGLAADDGWGVCCPRRRQLLISRWSYV
jgi:selenide,water dikinase